MKQIVITLDKRTMRTTVEAKGFTGSECLAATDRIERTLGKAGEREFKPEFNDESMLNEGMTERETELV